MYPWKESYAIGVESIDKAHEEMFRVLNRVHKIIQYGGNSQWAIAEALKFFKSYAIKHFQDEEDYMRSVGYNNYERHKAIHTGMREKILPRVYSMCEHSGYSQEAINKFLLISGKWLDHHIIGHDRELIKWAGNEDS